MYSVYSVVRPIMNNHSENTSRFVVGIDLGTTNSAVGFIDMYDGAHRPQTFSIPQLVAPETTEERDSLPSFHYEPAPGEFW